MIDSLNRLSELVDRAYEKYDAIPKDQRTELISQQARDLPIQVSAIYGAAVASGDPELQTEGPEWAIRRFMRTLESWENKSDAEVQV